MNTEQNCPACQKPLAPNAPKGLCPACLMKAGFATGVAPEPGRPSRMPGFVPPTVPEVARLFPQLEIEGLLGQGGMGAVYKARQPSLDRLVALKTLAPQSSGDSGFAERFTREARALARLNHPNIVGVFEFGVAGGLHYFIMEYVEGLNLRQVQQAGKLSPREALKIIPQICDALQFAHDEGVVHRDIKPENVMLDKKGRVKITDFGLAKILGREAKDLRLTGVEDVMGTPHYMAPEQVEHPQEVDHRADIYSLGVVFYELLTGELPLGKFQPPSKKVEVDIRLDEVVMHALEKEPERRYQLASQVKNDLEMIASRPGQPPASQTVAAEPASQPQAGRFWKSVAATLLVLLVLTMIGVIFANRRAWSTAKDDGNYAALVDIVAAAKDPYVQSQELELLPGGEARFRSMIRELNDSQAPLESYGFVNSDFVSITNITDSRHRPIVFETQHDMGLFRYALTLSEPVLPGEPLVIMTEGIMAGQVHPTGAPGVFEYSMRHWPATRHQTRRIELHRLPPGARLLDKQPGDLHQRVRDGRVELFIDRLIPAGDSLEVIYRYQLAQSGGGP